MSKIKKTLHKIVNLFFGRKIFQGFFIQLYKKSLIGMNYGSSDVSDDGEKYVLRLIKEMTKNSIPIIFDVGANKGQYTNLIDKVFQGDAKIYSFEPSTFTYSELLKSTSRIKNVLTYNFGFGSDDKDMNLYYDSPGSEMASVYERKLDFMNINFNKKEKVKIRKIDNFCRENNIETIDLLKMDVEGHEMEVFKGSESMLKGNKIKAIQFEFGGCNIDSRTYFKDFYFLLKDKYRIYRVLKDGLYEINQYSELYEIFTTTNYFAELK